MASSLIQHLVSLPPASADVFSRLEDKPEPDWFAASDPPGRPLGSGGGTVHLLLQAWRKLGSELSFFAWLDQSRKLVVHGGGQSRRLPAYGPSGKVLMPVPVFRWSLGQRLDQKLLDLEVETYESLMDWAP